MRVPHKSESTKVNLRGGVIRSSDTRSLIASRAKGSHHSSVAIATTRRRRKAKATEQAKPFEDISKGKVWQAYKSVRASKGAGGVDGQSIKDFEREIGKNLYKLWNRLSSGSYHPPAVKVVSIPKAEGGKRKLGIPTVEDRIAQMVVKHQIEDRLDNLFHKDSYGYRPGKSAKAALGVVRERNWKYDWVIKFDIKGMFDNINHALLKKALGQHISEQWVLLYIERWLNAPMSEDGVEQARTKGVPQGGVISPLLSNLFLHYAFDRWMSEHYPESRIVRYADDGIIHCKTRSEAEEVMESIGRRLETLGLSLHPEKTKLVYCGRHYKGMKINEEISFDFLGYTYRPRGAKGKAGNIFTGFLPAVSSSSKRAISGRIRKWNLDKRSDKSLQEIAKAYNPIIRGWMNYYCSYYPSAFSIILRRINRLLVKWVRRTLKSMRKSFRRSYRWLKGFARANQDLFAHWKLVLP